ncbi:hypothetical protein Dimus_033139, partial [Dionaea muscipula]
RNLVPHQLLDEMRLRVLALFDQCQKYDPTGQEDNMGQPGKKENVVSRAGLT